MRRKRAKARLTVEEKAMMREYAVETLGGSLQGHNEEELVQFCSSLQVLDEGQPP